MHFPLLSFSFSATQQQYIPLSVPYFEQSSCSLGFDLPQERSVVVIGPSSFNLSNFSP
jgi:hypothetical protein